MASFEEEKEEPSDEPDVGEDEKDVNIRLLTEVNGEISDNDIQTIKLVKGKILKPSKSMPLFIQNDIRDNHDQFGSEGDLLEVTVQQNGLQLSESYRPKVKFIEPVKDELTPGGRRVRKRTRTLSETSSLSAGSVSSSSSGVSVGAPDGGFGWVVVMAAFLVNMIADGVTFSFGVMFDELQEDFESSAAVTAGVVSMFHAVPLLTGPLATWLTDRYGCQTVTVVGSVIASAGFLLAAFSNHILLLYLFFGIVAGFGLSLCYVASIIVVAYYFDRRRSFATGISVAGSGVGTFLFAPLTQYLLDTYSGWRGATIILGGLFLNMAVCGMLFRELEWTKKARLARTSSSPSSTTGSQMPEIEELRLALESGDVSCLLDHEIEYDKHVATSLLIMPTYLQELSKVPENEIVDQVEENQTIREESRTVKLKRKVSSLLGGQKKSILKMKETETQFLNDKSDGLTDRLTSGRADYFKDREKLNNRLTDRLTDGLTDKLADSFRDRERLHHLRVKRQSLIYRGACLSTPRYQMRASSCPDIYKNTLAKSVAGGGEGESVSVGKWSVSAYVTIPFSVFCISNFILYFWYDVPYVYTIEYAENVLRVPNSESTRILSIIGILNTIGEVLVGWLSDQPWMSSIVLYSGCMCVCGVVTSIIPFMSDNSYVLALSALYGLFISANYSLTSPLLVDLVSIDQFSSAYGCLLACQGLGNLIGPPFAGWLYDISQTWVLTFAMAGLFMGISGIILIIIPMINLIRNRKVNQYMKEKEGPDPSEKKNLCNEDLNYNNVISNGNIKPVKV